MAVPRKGAGQTGAVQPAQTPRTRTTTGRVTYKIKRLKSASTGLSGHGRLPGGSAEVLMGRRTVSLPQDLIAEVEHQVAPREFSSYVAGAVRRQLERDRLDALLAQSDAQDGPLTDEARDAIDAELDAAITASL